MAVLLKHVTVLLTFGVSYPPLAVLIGFAICSHGLIWRLTWGRIWSESSLSQSASAASLASAVSLGAEPDNNNARSFTSHGNGISGSSSLGELRLTLSPSLEGVENSLHGYSDI